MEKTKKRKALGQLLPIIGKKEFKLIKYHSAPVKIKHLRWISVSVPKSLRQKTVTANPIKNKSNLTIKQLFIALLSLPENQDSSEHKQC